MNGDRKPRWEPSKLLFEAFRLACESEYDPRKGTDIPYISHLMAVSALVIEHGGTETQAAAAFLHDSLEDLEQGLEMIRRLPLDEDTIEGVVDIVDSCSDATWATKQAEKREQHSPDAKREKWKVRKQDYITKLRGKSSGDPALLVSLADKVHNAESSAADVRGLDPAARRAYYDKFNAGWVDQLWWYGSLVDAFESHDWPDAARPLVARLRAAVETMFGDDFSGARA